MQRHWLTLTCGFLILLLSVQFANADNPPEAPFTLGNSCDAGVPSYEWKTLVRTKWSIDMVFGLPTDVVDPDEWSSAESYRTEITNLLNGASDASSFAQACLDAWPNYAGDPAVLVVRFIRQFDSTTRIVKCVDSVWAIESETQSTESDFSDWLDVGEQPHFYSQTNAAELSNTIQEKLDQLNNQPGSSDLPSDVYTEIQ